MSVYASQPSPSQRVRECGPAAVSDLELLANIAGSLEVAAALMSRFSYVGRVFSAEMVELEAVPGVGPVLAARIASTREAWRRVACERYVTKPITSPDDVYALVGNEMRDLLQESLRVVLLNKRKMLIKVVELFRGTSNECMANPKEILRAALTWSADAIVMVHNHPSGNPSPSGADHACTQRVRDACHNMEIEMTDHIVIGRPGEWGSPYFSFREAGL